MPLLLIIGGVLILAGLSLLVAWFGAFLALLKAVLPLGVIGLGGLLAYFGWEERQDRRGAVMDFSSPAEANRYQADALAYQESLDQIGEAGASASLDAPLDAAPSASLDAPQSAESPGLEPPPKAARLDEYPPKPGSLETGPPDAGSPEPGSPEAGSFEPGPQTSDALEADKPHVVIESAPDDQSGATVSIAKTEPQSE